MIKLNPTGLSCDRMIIHKHMTMHQKNINTFDEQTAMRYITHSTIYTASRVSTHNYINALKYSFKKNSAGVTFIVHKYFPIKTQNF